MAQKKNTPNSGKKEDAATSNVTRIKASDARASSAKKTSDKKKIVENDTKVNEKQKQVKTAPTTRNPLKAFAGYLKGAWEELRQVRWPNRRTTWGLTLAVIIFTVFFVVLIVLLDYVFQWIFDKLVLG